MIILKSTPMSDRDIDHYRAELNRPRVKPGECDHPECTGVHSHSRPREEWCPRTQDQDRDWDNNIARGLYKYLWSLRASIDTAADLVEELGGPSAATRSNRHHAEPIPSGAEMPRNRAIVEGARKRRLDAVTTEAT